MLTGGVDDSAERRRTIKGRYRTFDNFDLAKVRWRDLQKAERRCLPAEQRQVVSEKLSVTSFQTLNLNVCIAKRRGSDLHSNAAGFVHECGDVAGTHDRLFFDLLARQDFDPDRLILDPAWATNALDDYPAFFFGMVVVFPFVLSICLVTFSFVGEWRLV